MTKPQTTRKKRANGVESRQRILDAAVEISGERGYEGTSIAAVSAACGLPASSIYWHFKDKDDLIAAVIERSFDTWLAAFELPDEEYGTPLERVTAVAGNVAKSLVDAPRLPASGVDARAGAAPGRAARSHGVPPGP